MNLFTYQWELYQLPHLRILKLSGNTKLHIDSAMKIITKLPSLNELYIDSMGIEKISHSFSNLKNLTYLDISNNKFKELPNSICTIDGLHTLCLNGVHDLDWEQATVVMKKMSHLKTLYMNNNDLKELPEELCHLSSLECLHVCHNNIEKAPSLMVLPKNLRELNISNNPISPSIKSGNSLMGKMN